MKAKIETHGGQFTVEIKLPRALVLSAILSIAGATTEAIRCEVRMQQLRAVVAQCQKYLERVPPAFGGQ
jgi:hypothetical protein